jgi:ssDNA-binding Zn-finger/Zn-ribbon topoisomerase 1
VGIRAAPRELRPRLLHHPGGWQGKVDEALARRPENGRRIVSLEVVQETGEHCPECERPLVYKFGRFGKFIACTGFPECRNTKPLLQKTGASCPRCGGDIVERRSRGKRRPFYGCSNYSKTNCDFVLWDRATKEQSLDVTGSLVAYEEVQNGWNHYRTPDASFDKPSRLFDQLQWLAPPLPVGEPAR